VIREYFQQIAFAQPQWLFLLLVIPLLAGWYISKGNNRNSTIKLSSLKNIQVGKSLKVRLLPLLIILRLLALALLIIALARPQSYFDEKNIEGDGIDIVLCIDVSGSMLAQDFQPNRLEAAKRVAADFIEMRPTDRIGLVIFAGESFTQCPITADYPMLLNQVMAIRGGFMADGTAIGSGLATSLDRLKSSTTKTRIVVLLTDGENNGGLIDPSTAKEIAKSLGIKVYTIGVGTDGIAPIPVQTTTGEIIMQQEKVVINEKLLTEIAEETGGKYFRAKDNLGLQNIYASINQLEKSKIEVKTIRRFTDKYYLLCAIAIALLMIEVVLRFTFFRKFP
jgi:Ca-activated chloride channel family protein